jgi:hypothetical protein
MVLTGGRCFFDHAAFAQTNKSLRHRNFVDHIVPGVRSGLGYDKRGTRPGYPSNRRLHLPTSIPIFALGYGSAVAFVLFVVILSCSLVQFRLLRTTQS